MEKKEKEWIEAWEQHVNALKDIEKMHGRKRTGANMRARNSYNKMFEADELSTQNLYPNGWC